MWCTVRRSKPRGLSACLTACRVCLPACSSLPGDGPQHKRCPVCNPGDSLGTPNPCLTLVLPLLLLPRHPLCRPIYGYPPSKALAPPPPPLPGVSVSINVEPPPHPPMV